MLVGARSETLGERVTTALADGGIDARFVRLDVTDPATIDAAAARIEEEHGRLDILVNNAAVAATGASDPADAAPPSRTTVAFVRAAFETNVLGVVAVTNAMLPLLRRSPAARIVNVSSELGSLGRQSDPSSPGHGVNLLPYNTSKSALNAVTLAYAKELADGPIKVNAATPGHCATDLNGHTGSRTAAEGAAVIAEAATLGADGPTGVFITDAGPEPW